MNVACCVLTCCLTMLSINKATAGITPTTLRCEFRENPLGIDVVYPRLSWILIADDQQRCVRQTAYQVLAASSNESLNKDQGDLWDSGIVQSDQSILVRYHGNSLNSCQQVFWKVRIWDQNNHISLWSSTAHWTTGIVKSEDWKSKWIRAPADDQAQASQMIVLRRSFSGKAPVRLALDQYLRTGTI